MTDFVRRLEMFFRKIFKVKILIPGGVTLVIFENPNLIFAKICVRFRADFTKCSENVRFLGVVWVYPGNGFI